MAMIQRCYLENSVGFKYYGGRGIKVCDRWRGPGGFVNFVLDMGRRPEGKTLDRKNPEAHYCPDNCRWAADSTQANNRRCNYTSEELKTLRKEAKAQALEMDPTKTELELEEATVF